MSWIKIIFINLIVVLSLLIFVELGFRINERYLNNEDVINNINPKDFRQVGQNHINIQNIFLKILLRRVLNSQKGIRLQVGRA